MAIIRRDTAFSLEDFKKVVFDGEHVSLGSGTLARVKKSHEALLSFLKKDSQRLVYGVHTGVGVFQNERSSNNWNLKQRKIAATHACGVGAPMETREVRAAIYLRSRVLARGFSAIHPTTFKNYASLLNKKILPRVPSQGSVGACGDLIPLAHIARYLFTRVCKGKLGPRDGLALINGTEASLGVGLVAWIGASRLFEKACQTAALSLFVLKGKTEAFDERLVGLKRHPHSVKTASKFRSLLGRYKNLGLPQDPYCLRAIPQVLGASLEIHEYAGDLLKREADSITDNPVILDSANRVSRILHGANFHGIHVALACDLEAWALNLLGLLSERRIGLLLSGRGGLPMMLAVRAGESGLMMAHSVAVACVAENKILSHPASSDSIATNIDQEDVVPMAMGAALKLKKVLENASRVITIEALCAKRAQTLALTR